MVIEIPLHRSPKFWSGFLCSKTLSDKRKNECQQCEDKHTESH